MAKNQLGMIYRSPLTGDQLVQYEFVETADGTQELEVPIERAEEYLGLLSRLMPRFRTIRPMYKDINAIDDDEYKLFQSNRTYGVHMAGRR